MAKINVDKIDALAKQWVKEAGEKIRKSFQDEIHIDYKANPNDLVTNMDQDIEKFFVERVQQYFPQHRILGEEGFGDNIASEEGTLWIIDPIDGTMNFVHQQCNFAISVGIYHEGVGQVGLIYDVVSDELFHCKKGEGAFLNEQRLDPLSPVPLKEAIIGLNATWVTKNARVNLTPLVEKARGTRSYGSAALELAYVASGRTDAYLTMRLSPWDFAAGLILIKEVGGVCTTIDSQPIRLIEKNSIFTAKPDLHDEIFQGFLQERT